VRWCIAAGKKSPCDQKGEEAEDEDVLRGNDLKDKRRDESSLYPTNQCGEASNYHQRRQEHSGNTQTHVPTCTTPCDKSDLGHEQGNPKSE